MRYLPIAILALLLTCNIAFAQDADILFRGILKIDRYTSSGNIINDIIMFVLVPSVFLILVIWQLVGRLMTGAHKGLAFLFGITIYLFTIASGYYGIFSGLAGPYFMFLILIYGLFYFLLGHFGVAQSKSDIIETAGLPAPPAAANQGILLRRYETTLARYNEEVRMWEDLKVDAKKNPMQFERTLATQRDIVSRLKKEVTDLEQEAHQLKLGSNFENTMRALKHRYGIR